jgi:hypothetical protein
VLVAEVVQPHRLLDVLEAVEVLERQTVGLPCGSAVLAEHVLTELVAAELVAAQLVAAQFVVAEPTAVRRELVEPPR